MQGESSSQVFLSYIKCWGKVKHRTEDTVSFPFPGLSRDQWCLLRDPLGGGRRGPRMPEATHASVGQKPTQNWKAVILQLEQHGNCRNIPGVQGEDTTLPAQGAGVRSLVGNLTPRATTKHPESHKEGRRPRGAIQRAATEEVHSCCRQRRPA